MLLVIEKMQFINITGPKNDIDRVVNIYLSKHEIHLENALSELNNVRDLRPFIEHNPYKDILSKVEDMIKKVENPNEVPSKELTALVEAVSVEEFMKLVQNTYYGRLNDATNPESLEMLYLQMYQQLYDTCSSEFSTSMAPVLRFLYLKEVELDMLTTSIECIRYKLGPGDILNYLKL